MPPLAASEGQWVPPSWRDNTGSTPPHSPDQVARSSVHAFQANLGGCCFISDGKKKKNHTLSHHHKMFYDFTSPSKMGCSNKGCSNPGSWKKSNIIFVNLWGKACIFLKPREMHNRYWQLLSRLMVMKLLPSPAPHQQCENPRLAHCCHHSSLITLAANSSPPSMYWTPCFLYRVPISTSKPSFTLKPKWSAVQIQICHFPA